MPGRSSSGSATKRAAGVSCSRWWPAPRSTLVLAITQGSGFWLAVTIGFDVAVGGYIALLQHAQQNARPNAPVVPLHLVEEDPHGASVRVVAG